MKQKRILFYVHDGTGFGHLSRLCKIAEYLQGDFSCLIVSGHRAMSYLVSEKCEYIHLPNIDSFKFHKSNYWNRLPFLQNMEHSKIIEFRENLMISIVKEFKPDIMIIDFFPAGKYYEIENIIINYECIKYYILRGIIDRSKDLTDFYLPLNEKSLQILEKYYNKIIVTCDEAICNVEKEFNFNKALRAKTIYAGFVSKSVSESEILQIRAQRGLTDIDKWIVCSSGSGKYGEYLIEECLRTAQYFPNITFDIVRGSQSQENWNSLAYDFEIFNRTIYLNSSTKLSFLHASADIVICHGGYNSLVESIEGGSYIIVFPNTGDQFITAKLLEKYHKILYTENISEMKNMIDLALSDINNKMNGKNSLNFNGLENIKKTLIKDINLK